MTSEHDLSNVRSPYHQGERRLTEDQLISRTDPIAQFDDWFQCATEAKAGEVNAMTLATCTRDGKPSARMVLLKGYGDDGIRFFTNYESRKGRELIDNPYAALVLYWPPIHRQVRIEGKVEKLSVEESTRYFHSRPRDSQISAAVSKQSTVIPNPEYIVEKWIAMNEKYADDQVEIPKPDYWGGFVLRPNYFEFWQGRTDRLHDRICFLRTDEASSKWKIQRLSP